MEAETVRPVPNAEGLYLIDAMMMDVPASVGTFLVDADRPVLIDTGVSTGVEGLVERVERAGVDPEEVAYVIVSHLHLDHAGGAGFLTEACPGAEFLCHPNAEPYLTDPERLEELVESVRRTAGENADSYGRARPLPEDRVSVVEDGKELDLGTRRLRVLHTEGHAPHHLSLFEPDERVLFVIDEGGAYRNGEEIVTTPPPNFDYERTLESFERFEALNPRTLLYSHFGINTHTNGAFDRHRRALDRWVGGIRSLWESTGDRDRVLEEVRDRFDDWDRPVFELLLERDALGVLRSLQEDG